MSDTLEKISSDLYWSLVGALIFIEKMNKQTFPVRNDCMEKYEERLSISSLNTKSFSRYEIEALDCVEVELLVTGDQYQIVKVFTYSKFFDDRIDSTDFVLSNKFRRSVLTKVLDKHFSQKIEKGA